MKFTHASRPGYTSLSAFHSVSSRAQPRPRSFQNILAADECGRTSSTHAQDHLLDLRCLNIHLTHHPRGLKKLPARGRGARLSTSPPDDENDLMWTVRGRVNSLRTRAVCGSLVRTASRIKSLRHFCPVHCLSLIFRERIQHHSRNFAACMCPKN